MDDLTAFVAARLDEDEAAARAAILAGDGTWTQGVSMFDSSVVRAEDASVAGDDLFIADYGDTDIQLPHAVHIARHDPARALREATACRAILTRYQDHLARMEDPGYPQATARDQAREYEDYVLPALAAIWDDHPDYRPEWKP